ncbi:MAG TPA: CBS domain-containing protein [Solirubrobacteraceae bacterium]|nr:CBS domain-containing protein [Solirubrobacteraceae bacterium]
MTHTIGPDQGSFTVPHLEHAVVADAMRHGVLSCPPEFPATVVARIMATQHVHAVIVEGVRPAGGAAEHLVWGVISDMDLMAAARGGADELTAGDLAVTEPVTVEPSLPLPEAVRLMIEHRTAHLIVAERGRPVGVLSTLDIAGVLAWARA